MAQKRAAGRGSRTGTFGSKDSVELGRNGEYRPAKKPSPEVEGVEGSQSQSQSDHVRTRSESTAIRALAEMAAAASDGATKPSREEEDGGGISSKYPTSHRQAPPSQEEEEEEEEEEEQEGDEQKEENEIEEESTDAPPGQLKRKRASSRVTRSQQRKVPAPAPQPSESKKHKSKKVTPAPAPSQLQGEGSAQPSEPETPKSKRIRRTWAPSDELKVLKALARYHRKQGKLPALDNNDFYDSIAKRLEDKTCDGRIVKEKQRSLMRRYISYVAPTTDHEKRLLDLSKLVWGDLPATPAANGNNGDGDKDEGDHAMAEAENGVVQNVDKQSFEEMCEMYPLLWEEVKPLVRVQPALTSSFTRLDGKRALFMEKRLGKLKWKELKIQAEMDAQVEAPKARIRRDLVNLLSKNV